MFSYLGGLRFKDLPVPYGYCTCVIGKGIATRIGGSKQWLLHTVLCMLWQQRYERHRPGVTGTSSSFWGAGSDSMRR